MAQTMISIRMDENLKKDMDSICQALGLNLTTAFTIFAKRMVREKRIPFEVCITESEDAMKAPSIDEQMSTVVNELVGEFGCGEHIITRAELQDIMWQRFHTTSGSIIPSDYCYNRLNNGITLKKPTLFEFLGGGRYRCLGENFCYNGPIYRRPKGASIDEIIGQCIDGERVPDFPFWETNEKG